MWDVNFPFFEKRKSVNFNDLLIVKTEVPRDT